MPISRETAQDIAFAYREIETAEKLLSEITDTVERREAPDIRDAFGRLQDGLQLGVPSGNSSHRLFNVPWTLARPIIEAHIAKQKSLVEALTEKALIEIGGFPERSNGRAEQLEEDDPVEEAQRDIDDAVMPGGFQLATPPPAARAAREIEMSENSENHTPGPWSARGTDVAECLDCWWLVGPEGQPIGNIDGSQRDPVQQANARLIASAPDLKDENGRLWRALRSAVSQLEALTSPDDVPDDVRSALQSGGQENG